MPNRHTYFSFILSLVSIFFTLTCNAVANNAQPKIESKAADVITTMSKRLSAAKSLSFTAVISYESPTRIGPPLLYTTKADVTLQRPNKLRIIISGDGPASEFYYDGKTMMAFSPAENLVAIANAPATIDAALKLAYDSAATYFPFSDVIAADPHKEFTDDLIRTFYIGQSQIISNTTTDMLAIENPWIFEQLWIGTDDKLPRRMRAVYRSDPLQLRHQIEFSNWKINPHINNDTFISAKARAAKPVPFAAPKPIANDKNTGNNNNSKPISVGGAS